MVNKLKYNYGDKVVPHTKTIWSTLGESSVWIDAQNMGQNFLYVTGFDEEVQAYCLDINIDARFNLISGDFFNESDFTLLEDCRKLQKKYKVNLPIGDWSDDGHRECQYFRIHSTHSVQEIRDAYYKSQELTKVAFIETYNKDHVKVCVDYDDSVFSEIAVKRLKEHGLKSIDLGLYTDEEFDAYMLSSAEFVCLFLWFVGLSLEGFAYDFVVDDEYEDLHTWGGGSPFCHQIGYGLF